MGENEYGSCDFSGLSRDDPYSSCGTWDFTESEGGSYNPSGCWGEDMGV